MNMWRTALIAGWLLAWSGHSSGQLSQNSTDLLDDDKGLTAKERFRRLIPYMTYYQFGSPISQQYQAQPQDQSYLYQPSPLVPVGYLVGGGFRSVPVYLRSRQQPQPQQQHDYTQFGYTPQHSSDLTSMITQNYLAIAKQVGGSPKEPMPPQYTVKLQYEEDRPKSIPFKPQKIYVEPRPKPQRIAYSQPLRQKYFRPTYAPFKDDRPTYAPFKDDSYVQVHSNYEQGRNVKNYGPDPDIMTITKSQELTFSADEDDQEPIPVPVSTTASPKIQTYYEQTAPPVAPIDHNSLLELITGYQLRKALPEKVTTANIGSSIQALSGILKLLQKVKAGGAPQAEVGDSYDDVSHNYSPSQTEASTPGRAGIDYPAYSEIPETSFSCKNQRYKGFFGDPDTNCQVWHYCDLNGGQASFLCPNGTIFSQVALTCDWWFNVKCASTAQLYVLNERLYKYILPAKPSFPEDYAGPLVDQYLTHKFQEIEAKKRLNSTTEKSPSTVQVLLNDEVNQAIK